MIERGYAIKLCFELFNCCGMQACLARASIILRFQSDNRILLSVYCMGIKHHFHLLQWFNHCIYMEETGTHDDYNRNKKNNETARHNHKD